MISKLKLSLEKFNDLSSSINFPYFDKSRSSGSKFFELKSPISISSGITNGIMRFRIFICIESVVPSPVVSTVKTLSFGGKIFLNSTLKADKSYVISDQPTNFS